MKAHETKLLKLLDGSKQFLIPIYQRTYSWSIKQCQQLLKDILHAGRTGALKGHFVGSVVYIQSDVYSATTTNNLLVIDGQQRLTTLSLLIACLAKTVELRGAALSGGMTPKKLRNLYLLNPNDEGDSYFKLLLTKSDKATLMFVIEGGEQPKQPSQRILNNYRFFHEQLSALSPSDLDSVYQGIDKLLVVDVSLERGQDNPQLIFESLNSTGLELSQADLIRNYVLMGLEPKQQEKLYTEHWFPMEQDFGHGQYTERFDRFMRDYLTVKLGRIPNIREVYTEFKVYASGDGNEAIVALVADIHRYARYYARIALGHEQDKELAAALADIRTLRVEVAYPFLLQVFEDHHLGVLTKEDVIAVVRLVESYVFRRAICEIPTNTLNKTFASLGNQIDRKDYVRSVAVALATKESKTRFPSDADFRQMLLVRNVYDFRNADYLLRKLENYDSKEIVNTANLTIEHVMPQNPKLSQVWQADLGADWKQVQEKYLHTLGNLTLTGYNPEMSDRPFKEKRDMKDGFRDSPIRLNKTLTYLDHWNESEIIKRAEALADLATAVWPYPNVPADLLVPKGEEEDATYSLDDHKKLTGALRPLFEKLSERIVALDPAIKLVVKKKYIAFRLHHHFAYVSAQNDRLRLVLQIRQDELIDPSDLARPIPQIATAKRSRVRVRADSDLDAVMALVNQAFEKDKAYAK